MTAQEYLDQLMQANSLISSQLGQQQAINQYNNQMATYNALGQLEETGDWNLRHIDGGDNNP